METKIPTEEEMQVEVFTCKIERDMKWTLQDLDGLMSGILQSVSVFGNLTRWYIDIDEQNRYNEFMIPYREASEASLGVIQWLLAGEKVRYHDVVDLTLRGTLSRQTLQKGIKRYFEEHQEYDDVCDIDALGAHAILEYALFDMIVYG